jgi:PEP-CTERM motif-containing protein
MLLCRSRVVRPQYSVFTLRSIRNRASQLSAQVTGFPRWQEKPRQARFSLCRAPARDGRGLMPHHRVLHSSVISAVSIFIATLSLLILSAGSPSAAQADSKRFVAHARGNSFDAAAATAAESTNPTIARMPVEEAGLVTEDDSLPNRAPALWSASSRGAVYWDDASSSQSSDETPLAYPAPAYDNGLRQDARDDANAPQFATMFYGSGGFYFYPAVPGVASGTGSDQTELGIGHTGQPDLSSTKGPGAVHNGVAPRIKWPLRILSDEPVPVPEPSSLLLLACGVFAVGLKRKL